LHNRNVDRSDNIRESVIHRIEDNIYFKGHIKHTQMSMYNLGKTEIILRISWLATYNPEINRRIGEVKLLRCLLLCGKFSKIVKKSEVEKRKTTIEDERDIRWTVTEKEGMMKIGSKERKKWRT